MQKQEQEVLEILNLMSQKQRDLWVATGRGMTSGLQKNKPTRKPAFTLLMGGLSDLTQSGRKRGFG
jgi:hypothetical protein